MTRLDEQLKQQFLEGITTLEAVLECLLEPIALTVERLVNCLLHDGKILVCGDGSSMALAQFFAATLINRFEAERPALPAIALGADPVVLNAIADDYDHTRVFTRQVEALGTPADLLLAISPSGHSRSVLGAVGAAQEKDMGVVAMTGGDGGKLAASLRDGDILLCVPTERVARIREAHLVIVHSLCEGIDYSLMGA